MKQLVQQLGDGSMDVLDVAMPAASKGVLLVQNHFSLISAGTEGGTVTAARKSLIGKARERPEQVRQVIETLRQQGIVQTYRAVSKKLDSYSPLGYSSAGTVLEVGDGVKGFSPGDSVACSGAGYASHAEVVAVPENLCVRLPKNADVSSAAYNTLGAIALQGIRQADLRVGESCIVIGLGLLGHLTCLILKASGVKVIGVDIDLEAVNFARENCTNHAIEASNTSIGDYVHHATGGINADAAIITAATDSTDPVNLAGRLLRKRGTVVIVGDVPTGFNREPDYYKKELSLKMSCSYGPGRYDLNYEEKGFDYPPGYVRWTENRNMQAFQELVYSGVIDLGYLTTHRFGIDNAPAAYDLILNKSERYLGILIEYDIAKTHLRGRISISEVTRSPHHGKLGVGFIGAGSYAMSHLLPNLPVSNSVNLTGVMTSSGSSSRSVAEKFKFGFVADNESEIINDAETHAVFVATRHDTHADYVRKVLEAEKHVFVEKPLCLDKKELLSILSAWESHKPLMMVGFNRRFSPLTQYIKAHIGDGPMSILYRVNAGSITADSWIQDKDLGGGRIIGEACHFIDFMVFMNGSLPSRVFAESMRDPSNLHDTVAIQLGFDNGSIGTLCYFANGPKALPKEYAEIYKGGIAARLLDFKEARIIHGSKTIRKKLANPDKGQQAMIRAFVDAAIRGGKCPIPVTHSIATTLATIGIVDSMSSGRPVSLNPLTTE